MGDMADFALEQIFEEEAQQDLEYEDRMYAQRLVRNSYRGSSMSHDEDCDAMKYMLENGF